MDNSSGSLSETQLGKQPFGWAQGEPSCTQAESAGRGRELAEAARAAKSLLQAERHVLVAVARRLRGFGRVQTKLPRYWTATILSERIK